MLKFFLITIISHSGLINNMKPWTQYSTIDPNSINDEEIYWYKGCYQRSSTLFRLYRLESYNFFVNIGTYIHLTSYEIS